MALGLLQKADPTPGQEAGPAPTVREVPGGGRLEGLGISRLLRGLGAMRQWLGSGEDRGGPEH